MSQYRSDDARTDLPSTGRPPRATGRLLPIPIYRFARSSTRETINREVVLSVRPYFAASTLTVIGSDVTVTWPKPSKSFAPLGGGRMPVWNVAETLYSPGSVQ